MNKENYKARVKQKFIERNLNGFAKHTVLADLMADICIEVVKANCNLHDVSNRRELLNDFSDKFNKQNELYDKPYIDTEDIEDYLKGVL